MGDLAFNEYSWRNSENTVRISNNIFTESLQKFYDTLTLHGHFARSPVFANNDYTKTVLDKNVRIPVSNDAVGNRGGVRPSISLKNVPRRYLDFWTGANSHDGSLQIYPACGTNITMLDYTPRLRPILSQAINAVDYIQNFYYENRPTFFWEITLEQNNVYPFGWKARYIGNENAFLAEYSDLVWCSGFSIYSGINGIKQTEIYSFKRDTRGGSTSTNGTFTDMFIPVRLQKTGGVYDDIYIPYMRNVTALSVTSGSNSSVYDYIFTQFGAQYTNIKDTHFIFCSSVAGDFNANPWAGTNSGDIGRLINFPAHDSNAKIGSFILMSRNTLEDIFTGSGMPWSYDEDLVKSPDDGGLNKPIISGQPDNPTDDDIPGTGDNTSDIVEYPSPLYIPNATVYDRYFLTPNQVPDVKKFLFSDTFVDNVRRLWTNPAEYVISLVCYPFDVESTGLTTTSGVVSVGGVSSNIAAAALTDKGVPYFYGGSVYVDKYYNSYLDYEPYTSIDIYIPYIGVRPLNVSQVVGHTLCIGYYIDLNTQQITALIGLDGQGGNLGQVVTQFVGSIGIQTPLSGTSAQDMIRNIVAQTSGLITGVGAIAGGVMSANPALLASGVASTSNALLGGGHTAPSYYGSLSPVSGLYTPQVAYLIINRPRQAMPAAYLTQQGFSSNYSGKVSQFSGYLECASVSLSSTTTMTASEQQEIINLLTGGIYCG